MLRFGCTCFEFQRYFGFAAKNDKTINRSTKFDINSPMPMTYCRKEAGENGQMLGYTSEF